MDLNQIGEKFRMRRKLLKLRQRDVSELAEVTLRGLTDLENGKANPTFNQLSKIADILGLEIKLVEKSLHEAS